MKWLEVNGKEVKNPVARFFLGLLVFFLVIVLVGLILFAILPLIGIVVSFSLGLVILIVVAVILGVPLVLIGGSFLMVLFIPFAIIGEFLRGKRKKKDKNKF